MTYPKAGVSLRVMKRPVSLTIAVVLQWISAIAGIISGWAFLMIALATFDSEARRGIEEVLSEAGITDVSGAAVGAGIAIVGVLVIALSIVRIIVAVSLGRGRNWARILITVLAILNILVSIGQLFGGEIISGVVGLVIEAIILWLMWNSSSSAYIRVRSDERAAARA